MPTSAPEVTHDLADPSILVIEAATAELALEEVHARLGADAEILVADRVTRGGVGGFFAREVVQLRARRPGADRTGAVRPPDIADPAAVGATPGVSQPPSEATRSQPMGLDGLLADMVAQAGSEERSFAEVLRGKLPEMAELGVTPAEAPAAPAPTAPAASAPAAPVAPVAEPAPPHVTEAVAESLPWTPARSATAPGVVHDELQAIQADWSLANLQRLGLPMVVLDAVRSLDPRDEAAWVAGIARAVGTLTRPLPSGPAVLAGPRAAKLAAAMGIETVAVGSKAPAGRAFAVVTRGGEQARSWLAYSRGRRWLHVVVGGEGWRPLLFDEPLAVSWMGEDNLCEAIRLCAELGLVLGYGLQAGEARRATPLEVALAIRDLLPQR